MRRKLFSFAVAGWIAVMLKERYDLPQLYVLTHGRKFEGDRRLAELLERYGIRILTEEIVEILGDPKKALKGFRVGEQVGAGQVLCIVEAMKLMNEIQSEVRGKVTKMMVQNGDPVEFGQTLYLVDES